MSIDVTVTSHGKTTRFSWSAFAHYMAENAASEAWKKATRFVLGRIEAGLMQYANK